VQPPARAVGFALGGWTETSLYQFAFEQNLYGSPLTFDSAGNMYGSTAHWSGNDKGAVYQLARNGNGWNVNVIYQFSGGNDGRNPVGSLAIDSAGNIYGVTDDEGPYDYGLVYELSPSPSGWVKTTLYAFQGGDDGWVPFGGLIFDHAGNLLGSTASGGSRGGGTVFQLTPQAGRGWVFTTLYGFAGHQSGGPVGSLTLDAAGSIYGALTEDGNLGENGSIFKLTLSNGSWTYSDLHSFAGEGDGDLPNGSLVVDARGNVYGTTSDGGAYNYGLVFQITP
ncbi:MAG: choice-of-anchor tandem repeat GloVer-containing protein, partial [Candidatus Korobacteraceae bacterium]